MPVVDPDLKAKILAARQMLGKQYVTDEDLWRLEREGRFANLNLTPKGSNRSDDETDRPLPNQPAPSGPVAPGGQGDADKVPRETKR